MPELAECPPAALPTTTTTATRASATSTSTSTSTCTSRSSQPRISRKQQHGIRGSTTTTRKARNVSIKFQAQNFVTAHDFGTDFDEYYTVGDKIGEGGFGEVFAVVHQKTGAERAVKVIYKTEDDDVDFEKVNTTIRNEFAVVKSLDHPNLLKQYEMFEDEDKFMIVTDLYRGGELLDELEAIGCFQEEDAALLLNHMLTCINYIHANHMVHRDLKPENILLEENMKLDDIKIIDFGLARRAAPGVKFKEFVGTSYYMAPQIVNEQPYTSKCDIWSCGVICFMVLGGYAPFDGDDVEEICNRIEDGTVVFDDEPEIWDSVSDTAKDFIRYLLTYDEDDRPTALQALQHPWLETIRTKTRRIFRRKSSLQAEEALSNLQDFEAGSKLKQATYALIASQLLLKSEKDDIDQVFRVLDHDCSGRLSKDEVKHGYKDFYGIDLSEEEVDVIFKRVNFSGSGAIEYSEFVVASLMSKNLLDDGKVKAAFDEFDIDGNGFIDIDELKKVLVVDDDMDDYVLNKIIKQVDKDGDNQISYDEFKSMMYITASQPTKENRQSWQKRRESLLMMDESGYSMNSSISSHYNSNKSLKDIGGAGSVLSIFDIMSDQSMRLDHLEDLSLLEDDCGAAVAVAVGGGIDGKSLSNMTGAIYSDRGPMPPFRRNRSLPTQSDPIRGYLKVRYSNRSDKTPLSSTYELPRVEESLSNDSGRFQD